MKSYDFHDSRDYFLVDSGVNILREKYGGNRKFWVKSLILKIKLGINRYCVNLPEMDDKVYYKGAVIKNNMDYYDIYIHHRDSEHKYNSYDHYCVFKSEQPYLIKELDKLVKITEEHDQEQRDFEAVKIGMKVTDKQKKNYLRYARKLKWKYDKRILAILTSYLAPFIYFTCHFMGKPGALCFLYLMYIAGALGGTFIATDGEQLAGCLLRFWNYILTSMEYSACIREVKKKLKGVTKQEEKIDKIKKEESSQEKLVVVKNEDTPAETKSMNYRNGMLKTMEDMRVEVMELNEEEKKEKLARLQAIYSEYLERLKDINSEDTSRLTLENHKQELISDIINDLAALQMEINIIRCRDEKNMSEESEQEQFKETLEENLRAIGCDTSKYVRERTKKEKSYTGV